MVLNCGGADGSGQFGETSSTASSSGSAGGEENGGGSLNGSAGNDASSSLMGTGGNSSSIGSGGENQGGSAGEECVPQASCQSLSAECGEVDTGCGIEICPDNCQAPLTCGGAGEQFKCGCAPKSCGELGKNCGLVDDGCGGMVECGECDEAGSECGGQNIAQNGSGFILTDGVKNICSQGCAQGNNISSELNCNVVDEYSIYWSCIYPQYDSPADDCLPQPIIPSSSWCCK